MAEPRREPAREPKLRRVPTASAVLRDGAVVELVYSAREDSTSLVVWSDGSPRVLKEVETSPFERLVPYSPSNNLLRHEVVLLPSGPAEYGTEAELVRQIRNFIHRYVDVSPLFEQVASYYVLLTWIYDSFNELPYLRLRGEPGTGKTRFLLTVGSLCYKPMFASGASTVSPLFRIIDSFRGTLLIDEADFRMSDERAEIVKLLNNGNARGFPVLRSEAVNGREFNPRAYHVFGPKLVATRRVFEDRALESRCLTEETGHRDLREDVPINLPPAYKDEALALRNQLLTFRFRHFGERRVSEALVDRAIEPRLNQIFIPLLSVIDDEAARAELRALARRYNGELAVDRSMDSEAQVLEVIRGLLRAAPETRLGVKEITERFNELHGADYERRITTRWIGGVIRRRLGLKTRKSHGAFVIPLEETAKLPRLYERYGVSEADTATGDLGDLGDIGGDIGKDRKGPNEDLPSPDGSLPGS